jgi:hypothetical protein
MFFYLIYTSKADKLMPADDLIFLLEQSSRNNLAFDITGMLLYMETRFITKLEGRFIQVLEGTEGAVQQIYSRIIADKRHNGVLLLNSGFIAKRRFPDWSMAFSSIDEKAINMIPGFKDLSATLHDPSFLPGLNIAVELLNVFISSTALNKIGRLFLFNFLNCFCNLFSLAVVLAFPGCEFNPVRFKQYDHI